MDYNWIAVRVATNLYLTMVKAACRFFFTNRISKASNQQAELFHIVCDLSRTGSGDRPPPSFSPDQFAAFLKSKVEAIHWAVSYTHLTLPTKA